MHFAPLVSKSARISRVEHRAPEKNEFSVSRKFAHGLDTKALQEYVDHLEAAMRKARAWELNSGSDQRLEGCD